MSETSAKPKNVVVLDAENPLVEIHGEFFWREDHERLLAAAREQAFRDGFAQGCAASQPPLRQRPIVVRTRVRKHRLTRLVIALLLLSFVLSVILTVVQAARRLQ